MTQQLGIFQGKKNLYNTLILKGLVTGSKTTKQVAEYIYDNGREQGINRANVVKKIYSVIDRRGGRLDELSRKHYISRKDLKWDLTIKGVFLSLTLFQNMDEIKRFIPYEELTQGFIKRLYSFEENKESLPPIFRSFVKSKEYKKEVKIFLDDLKSESSHLSELFLWKIRAFMIEQASKGVDLDSMTDEEFFTLYASVLAPWLYSPEFQDALKVKHVERR